MRARCSFHIREIASIIAIFTLVSAQPLGSGGAEEYTGHWVVGYNPFTGEILRAIGSEDLGALLHKIAAALPEDDFTPKYEIIDNYPNREDILRWTSMKYIFDLEENKVREMTEEELKRAQEKWRRQALESILRSVEVTPDNWIRANLKWSIYSMYVETDSFVLGVRFNSTNKQLYIDVSGESGTPGTLYLIVPQELIPSTKDVKVYLDGSPVDFTITQAENYYSIHVAYTHSLRTLTVHLIALAPWYAQPFNLVLVALAATIIVGVAYWFKLRR